MATTEQMITSEWTQITDGTKDQVMYTLSDNQG